ncbi:hypothetical protein KBX06_16735 [Micromonospora sp. C31]|uniref:hypothetical protein n=1 Tax=Micromonospora sp. C31 TaxID=2824876 RepID=UPI001B35D823|nr:hypothetical protein [Micromonospora sp. C31]MBQ1074802.1 hypothetical protein [Micromonospora sp. C31]
MVIPSLSVSFRDFDPGHPERVDHPDYRELLDAGIACLIRRRGLPSRAAVLKECHHRAVLSGRSPIRQARFVSLFQTIQTFHECLAAYARWQGKAEAAVALTLRLLGRHVVSLRAGEVSLGEVVALATYRNLRVRVRSTELAAVLEGAASPLSRARLAHHFGRQSTGQLMAHYRGEYANFCESIGFGIPSNFDLDAFVSDCMALAQFYSKQAYDEIEGCRRDYNEACEDNGEKLSKGVVKLIRGSLPELSLDSPWIPDF